MLPLQIGTAGGVLGGVLLIVLGIALLHFFARGSVRRLRQMIGTDTSTVEEVEPGRVELEGTVRSAGESVGAQMDADEDTGAVISEYREKSQRGDPQGTRPSNRLRIPVPQQLVPNVGNSRAAVPFYVEDDTGDVLVDAATAESSLSADAKSTRRYGDRGWEAEVEGASSPATTST